MSLRKREPRGVGRGCVRGKKKKEMSVKARGSGEREHVKEVLKKTFTDFTTRLLAY